MLKSFVAITGECCFLLAIKLPFMQIDFFAPKPRLMLKLLPFFISIFWVHGLFAQQRLDVYRVIGGPSLIYRVELVHNEPDGGMLLAGRLRYRNGWTGHHLTRVDAGGRPVWSTFLRNAGDWLNAVFPLADGGAGIVLNTIGGKKEIWLFSGDGTLLTRAEYIMEGPDDDFVNLRLEAARQLDNGDLIVTALGVKGTHTFVGGQITVDPGNGTVIDQAFWAVNGMLRPARTPPRAPTEVIYAAGHSRPDRNSNIAALTPGGTLLRQWDLVNTMGEYGEHHQLGNQLLLLDIHEQDLSVQLILLDASQQEPVWTAKIPLIDVPAATNRYQGQMLPKFKGYDDDHLYFWMDPVDPNNKMPQLVTIARRDGNLVSVVQGVGPIANAGIPDVLSHELVRVTASPGGERRLFTHAWETGETILQQKSPEEETCLQILAPTDDYTPLEPLEIKQVASNLEMAALDLTITVVEKSIADLQPRPLGVAVRQLCRPSFGEVAPEIAIEQLITGIYPNPTFDRVTVGFSTDGEEVIAELYLNDLVGRQINVRSTDREDGNIDVDLSDLPSGVYLLTVVWQGQRFTERIVKQ